MVDVEVTEQEILLLELLGSSCCGAADRHESSPRFSAPRFRSDKIGNSFCRVRAYPGSSFEPTFIRILIDDRSAVECIHLS